MQRINGANFLPNGNGAGKNAWQDYNAGTGQAGTIPNAQTLNAWQEELCTYVESWLGALNAADNTQIYQAISAHIATQMRGMFAPEPTVPASMVVNLTAGFIPGASTVTQIVAQSTSAFVAPVGNPRIDRIVISRTTGLLSVVAGIPGATPAAPAVPAGAIPIAQVALTPTTVAVTAAMLTDERDLPPLGLGVLAYLGVGAGLALDGLGNLTLAAGLVSGTGTAGHLVKWLTASTVGDGGALGTAANLNASSANAGGGLPAVYAYAGNPNGHVAGTAGIAGTSPPDMVWDITDGMLWVCTASGIAAAAVWKAPASFIESSISAATAIGASNTAMNYVATAALTLTIARTTTLATSWTNTVFALGGSVTIAINAADAINGGTAGLGAVIPKGWFGTLTTDANGNLYLEMGQATLGSTTLASAATVDLGSSATSNIVITGTIAITSFGASAQNGQVFNVTFSGSVTLTQNAASMILPTSANITTAPNDTAQFLALGAGNFRCIGYQTASGAALITNLTAPVVHVQDQRASGTAGQALAATTWNVRTLQTVVRNTIAGASLASNQVTLPAGTYDVTATAAAHGNAIGALYHKIRLRNITGGVTLLNGTNEFVSIVNATTITGHVAKLNGRIVLAGVTVVELDHYTTNVASGYAASSGEVEVYADLMIWKVG